MNDDQKSLMVALNSICKAGENVSLDEVISEVIESKIYIQTFLNDRIDLYLKKDGTSKYKSGQDLMSKMPTHQVSQVLIAVLAQNF